MPYSKVGKAILSKCSFPAAGGFTAPMVGVHRPDGLHAQMYHPTSRLCQYEHPNIIPQIIFSISILTCIHIYGASIWRGKNEANILLFSRNFYSSETHMDNIQYTNVLRIIWAIDYNHQLIKTLIGLTCQV